MSMGGQLPNNIAIDLYRLFRIESIRIYARYKAKMALFAEAS